MRLVIRAAAVPGHASKHVVITAPEQLSLEQYRIQSGYQAVEAYEQTYADKIFAAVVDRMPDAALLAGKLQSQRMTHSLHDWFDHMTTIE